MSWKFVTYKRQGDHLEGLDAEHRESSPPTSVRATTQNITPTYNTKKLPDL